MPSIYFNAFKVAKCAFIILNSPVIILQIQTMGFYDAHI